MIVDEIGLSCQDRDRLERLLLEFDERWSSDSLAKSLQALTGEADNFRFATAVELVKIDLHRHWGGGQKKAVEDYESHFKSIGIESIPAELVLAEFLARHASGDTPSAKEFQQRFPGQFGEFKRLFQAERARRSGLEKVQASISTDASRAAAVDTQTENHADPNTLPENFGRYRILKRLGAGAMGAVYLAHDSQLDRQVAVKTPSFGGSLSDDLVERFYREARAAANLRHPHICPVFDVGQIDGRHYITMAFIAGKPLSAYVGGAKPLDQKAVAGILRKLALALSEAHASGVIHRDLKPANIMVDRKRQPLVMDFGLARREDEMQSRMTQSGVILGTPAYMSPEQVKGQVDEVGPQADIYSLGIILYELLTGRLPFEGTVAAVIGQILTEAPAPPVHFRDDLDPPLEAVCLKMIAKEKTDRYATMKEVAADLADYLKGEPPSIASGAGAPTPHTSSLQTSVPISSADPLDVLPLDADLVAEPLAAPRSVYASLAAGQCRLSFWKSRPGRFTLILALLLGVTLIAWSVTLVFRTPYGALTITTDDPDLIVEVDGQHINVRDDSPIQFADGSHELSLRIGDYHLPIGSEKPFEIVGRDGQYALSAKIGDTELRSGTFAIDRGEKTSLVISLTRDAEVLKPPPDLTELPKPAPLAPLSALQLIGSRERRGHGPINWLAYAPDSKTFASAGGDKTVKIWNFALNEVLATLTGHKSGVQRVAYSSSGQQIASCDENSILIWDAASHQEIVEIDAPGVLCIAYSPAGDMLAWAGKDGNVRLLDSGSGKQLRVIAAHDQQVFAVAWSPDGEHLATASKDRRIVIWDVANGFSERKALMGHEQYPITLAFSPDSQTLASYGVERTIKLWDVASGTRKHSIAPNSGFIWSLSFTPDGKVLAGGGVDRRISLWDAQNGKLIWQTPRGNNNILASVFAPDGSSMVSSTTAFKIMTWNVVRGGRESATDSNADLSNPKITRAPSAPKLAATLQPGFELAGHTGPITSLALAPDGRQLASGSVDKTVRIWDLQLGRQIGQLTCPAPIWRLNFAPGDSGKLAISCDDSNVLIWQTDPRLSIFDAGQVAPWNSGTVSQWGSAQGGVIDVAFSNDGKLIATAGDDGTAKIWDASSQRLIRDIKAHEARCTVVRFSPDGNKLVTGGKRGQARVWDLKASTRLTEYTGHDAALRMVFCGDLSPDGRLVAMGGNDGNVHLWSIETGQAVHVFRGHQDEVISVQFSKDGRHVVSGSFDGTFRVWDGESGPQVQQGSVELNGANIAIFGPESGSVITAGGTGPDWKPVGGYSIRYWERDGAIASRPSAERPSDYQHLLAGQWVSWQDDLVSQVDGKKTWVAEDGAVEMKDGIGWCLEQHLCRNALIRTQIRKTVHGGDIFKPYLILRYSPNGKSVPEDRSSRLMAYLKGWNRIGIQKNLDGKWITLIEKDIGRKLDDWFEWTMAVVDNHIIVYIDGKQELSVENSDTIESGFPFFSTGGRARIRAIEVMVLDDASGLNASVTPPADAAFGAATSDTDEAR